MKVYFPHEKVRDEQARFMSDIAEAISRKKTILANAPTGLGKTASSLAPALSYAKDVQGHKKKVFFLTPKSSQHQIVLETANLMNQKFGLRIKTIDLVGKQKMCIHPLISNVRQGFYEACNSAKKAGQCSYYTNAKPKTPKQKASSAVKKARAMEYNKDYEKIKNSCYMEELCPYEITLEMTKNANLIIADYFHMFDDTIRKNIFAQAGIKPEDTILIIDEAHNLPKRVRDMLSSTLKSEDLEKAGKEAKEIKEEETMQVLKDIAKEVEHLAAKIPFGGTETKLENEDLSLLKKLAKENIEKIMETASIYMHKNNKENSFLLYSAHFLNTLLLEKKNTLHLAERKMNSLRLSIYPLDVGEATGEIMNGSHSSILMSGTLSPLEMFADILGVKNAELKNYVSPFPKQNRLDIIVGKTTTKYTHRNREQFEETARIISSITREVPGNTIVFFPSFELLRQISPHLTIARKVLEQTQKMEQSEKNKLVSEFKKLGHGFGGTMLAVSGGSMAEGIDFPGENLKCAIIVGLPFAKVSQSTKALIEFYDKKFGKGWDYAYNAPAINRAVQAAGRVIRTEKDRGVCVFLDSRFCEAHYLKFFPKNFLPIKTNEPETIVKQFFA